jgi:hypothetical protein
VLLNRVFQVLTAAAALGEDEASTALEALDLEAARIADMTAELRQTHDPNRPRYRTPGRRGMRALSAGKYLHRVPAIGPGNLNREWRRIVAAILARAEKPALALAQRLGNAVSFLPLAVAIIKAEMQAAALRPGGRGRPPATPIGAALSAGGALRFAKELLIYEPSAVRKAPRAEVEAEADATIETGVQA